MQVLTLGPAQSSTHKAAQTLFPDREFAFGQTIDDLFFRLAEKKIDALVVPLEGKSDGFVEETIINLMKYDYAIIAKIEQEGSTYYALGKTPKERTGESFSSFLIFSEPMASTKNQIFAHCRENKLACSALKNLLLQEGHTPLYYLEIEGHIEEPGVAKLFETLGEKFLIKHIGSYPA